MCQITVELICGLSRNEPQVCMCVLSEKWVCRTFGCSLMSPDNPDFVRAPEYALLSAGKAERLMRHSRVSPLLPNIGRKLSSHHSLYNACCWFQCNGAWWEKKTARAKERYLSWLFTSLTSCWQITQALSWRMVGDGYNYHTRSSQLTQQGLGFSVQAKLKRGDKVIKLAWNHIFTRTLQVS